jgi:predicted protein tyrosine phosphatase
VAATIAESSKIDPLGLSELCSHVRLVNLSLLFDTSPTLWSPSQTPFTSLHQLKPPTIILSGFLYLSSVSEAMNPRICGPDGYLKPTHIINATNRQNTSPFRDCGVKYLNVTVNDTLRADLTAPFRDSFEFIEAARRSHGRGARVLVHCAMGISRSPSLVIYYLMRARGMTLREAYAHVKRQRPETFPNSAFMQQLIAAERAVYPDRPEPSIHSSELGSLGGLRAGDYDTKTPSTAAIQTHRLASALHCRMRGDVCAIS